MNSGELSPESQPILVRVPAGASVVLRIEIEAAPAVIVGATRESAREARQAAADRFWTDWCRRCLPLPLGLASTAGLYAAHRHWAQLQDVPPSDLTGFVQLCVERHLAHKARTLAFVPGEESPRQVSTLAPYGEPRPTGQRAVGTSIASFDAALARWKAAARVTRGGGGGSNAA